MNSIYSDEELIAFLDGAIAADIAAEISTAAKHDPTLARRITELGMDANALKTAFEPLLGVAQARNLAHKLECASSREIANRSEQQNGLWRVASYAAAIVVGVALSWTFLSPKPDWRIEVAHYQALYVPDTLMTIAPDNTRLQTEFARASKALNLVLDPLAFSDVDGLKLRRAQVLGFEGMPLVQIAFTLPDGRPVAFCILQQSGEVTAATADTFVGLTAASWSTKTHKFLAIGETDTADILELANRLRQRL